MMLRNQCSQQSLHALSTHTHSIQDLSALSSSVDQIYNKSCERLAHRKTKLFSQSENSLIKSYIEAVSRQYKINNQKSSFQQDNSSIKSQSQVKRKIRLSSTKDKRAGNSSIAKDIKTPIKLINNDSNDHLEVIRAHLRRRTAGTTLKNGNSNLVPEKAFGTNLKLSKSRLLKNKHIINTSFSDQNNDSESIFSPIEKQQPLPIPSHQTSIQNIQDSRKYSIFYPKSQATQNFVYCPICEQTLQTKKIAQHQKLCSKLEDLYNLAQQNLLEYVKWKIQMHLYQLKSALQQQKSFEEFTEQNPQSKSLYKLSQKKTIFETETNQPNLTNLLDLCEEQIKKCKWFLRIKMEIEEKQKFF